MINTWGWHYVSAFVTNRGVLCDCAIQYRQSHLFSSKMLIEYSYLISFMLMEYELIKFSYYLCSRKQNQSLDTLISSWGFASLGTSDSQAKKGFGCQDVAIKWSSGCVFSHVKSCTYILYYSCICKVVYIHIYIYMYNTVYEAFLLDSKVTPQSCSGLLKGSTSFISVFPPLCRWDFCFDDWIIFVYILMPWLITDRLSWAECWQNSAQNFLLLAYN